MMIDSNKYEVYAQYQIATYIVDMLNVIGATMHTDFIDEVNMSCGLYSSQVTAYIGYTKYVFSINNQSGVITCKYDNIEYQYNYNDTIDMFNLLNLITTIACTEIEKNN